MAQTIYLAITDASGNPIPGSAAAPAVKNPFRSNSTIVRPFTLTEYTFGVDAPLVAGTGTGGGSVSKPNPTELVLQMKDNASTAALFRTICSGLRLNGVDVLVVSSGTTPTVIAGISVTTALVTGLGWDITTGGITRTLRVDGMKFAAGSTTPNADGSAGPFTFATFDTSTGVVT